MIAELGHVATWSELQPHVTRRAVTAAMTRGEVERLSRDRYATPGLHAARREAERHHGVVSHLSAAVHHGFKVRTPPARPKVTVPRTHHVTRADEDCCEIRLRHLGPGDHAQGVTTPLRTVVDCARDLPFEEALCVADSALRSSLVTPDGLVSLARRARGPGARALRRVAQQADGGSSGPMETVLRVISLDRGLDLSTQLQIVDHGLFAVVDLGDPALRLAVEADSFAWHGDRRALDRDCRRYDELVVWGWTVLRFSWEQVMIDRDFVEWCFTHVLDGRDGISPPVPRVRGVAAAHCDQLLHIGWCHQRIPLRHND